MQAGGTGALDGCRGGRRDPVPGVEQRAVDVEDDAPEPLSFMVCVCLHLVLGTEVGVARLRIAYIGGGSTRGAGTMASFIEQGENFSGSEIVLVDLNEERLELIGRLAQRMAVTKGVDLTVTATTDRRAGLQDCDAVLTSYRPGGFQARVLDERIPLSHGVIGQETQGPGGFFMALRSIHVMHGILDDIAVACPGARIFNYTNPVNIVAQAVTDHSDVPFVSLCEGPIVFPEMIAEEAGLDPALLDVASVGLNHGSWSVRHQYDGRDLLPLVQEAYARRAGDPSLDAHGAPRPAAGIGHGGAAERVLPVLLLRGRGPARADRQADDAGRGHPRLGVRLLGPLRRAGRQRQPGARPRPARAAGSTSSSSRSTAWTRCSTTAARRCR